MKNKKKIKEGDRDKDNVWRRKTRNKKKEEKCMDEMKAEKEEII